MNHKMGVLVDMIQVLLKFITVNCIFLIFDEEEVIGGMFSNIYTTLPCAS